MNRFQPERTRLLHYTGLSCGMMSSGGRISAKANVQVIICLKAAVFHHSRISPFIFEELRKRCTKSEESGVTAVPISTL